MLEAARDLFEAAPKVATALEQAAINSEGGGTKKEGGGEIKEQLKAFEGKLHGVTSGQEELVRQLGEPAALAVPAALGATSADSCAHRSLLFTNMGIFKWGNFK